MTFQRQVATRCSGKATNINILRVDYIKNAVSPRDFYQHELREAKLKAQGWNDGGLCPFHSDTNPGSFRVNLSSGAFKCFACIASGGDIVAFTMSLHGLDFYGALLKLGNDWGIL